MKKILSGLIVVFCLVSPVFADAIHVDPNGEESFVRLTNSGKILYIPSNNYGVVKPFICNVATKPSVGMNSTKRTFSPPKPIVSSPRSQTYYIENRVYVRGHYRTSKNGKRYYVRSYYRRR